MVTERTLTLIESLRKDVEGGKVWLSDFRIAKETLNRDIYRDAEKGIRDLLLNSGDGKGSRASHADYPGINALYWALPHNVHEVASASKKYAKCRAECPENVQAEADAFFEFWLPVRELLAKAKTMLVKGRRPSENVDDSERRTLENTGTCPVCGGNFKLTDNGKLVNHGYTVEYRSFQGGCPGIGFEPWEVSPKGAESYANDLEYYLDQLVVELADWKDRGLEKVWSHKADRYVRPTDEPDYRYFPPLTFATALEDLFSNREHQIKQIRSQIKYYRDRIAVWKASTLPGILAGFLK